MVSGRIFVNIWFERSGERKKQRIKNQRRSRNERSTKLVRKKSTERVGCMVFNMWNVTYIVRCHYWTPGHKLLSCCWLLLLFILFRIFFLSFHWTIRINYWQTIYWISPLIWWFSESKSGFGRWKIAADQVKSKNWNLQKSDSYSRIN